MATLFYGGIGELKLTASYSLPYNIACELHLSSSREIEGLICNI